MSLLKYLYQGILKYLSYLIVSWFCLVARFARTFLSAEPMSIKFTLFGSAHLTSISQVMIVIVVNFTKAICHRPWCWLNAMEQNVFLMNTCVVSIQYPVSSVLRAKLWWPDQRQCDKYIHNCTSEFVCACVSVSTDVFLSQSRCPVPTLMKVTYTIEAGGIQLKAALPHLCFSLTQIYKKVFLL